MIAILPLLFANGHPMALKNFTAAELEKFITFMVTCSWGHDTASAILQPPWWPADVPFAHPFAADGARPADWPERLRAVVRSCYEFHKSTFLLVFSAQLARHPRARLRYVDNRDHTTSLYDRRDGKLLVTFRNENLHYDARPIVLDDEEPAPRPEIYLCDHCDSHFDDLRVLRAHERLCNAAPAPACAGGLADFLAALRLRPAGAAAASAPAGADAGGEARTKTVRSAAGVDRGPPYPFSSLAYLRNAKTNVQRDTTYSRERVERYCCTNPPPSKVLVNKSKNNQFPVRYRRPVDYWRRVHTFPEQRGKRRLDVRAQLLLLRCRPLAVRVRRLSAASLRRLAERAEAAARAERDARAERAEPAARAAEPACEVIDLCSDEEGSENCDPRAGVACVVRGGAVLRRAAAPAPRALPAAPCGARQRVLPAPRPHPVILIAHTLNTLQTISLE